MLLHQVLKLRISEKSGYTMSFDIVSSAYWRIPGERPVDYDFQMQCQIRNLSVLERTCNILFLNHLVTDP
jgi:hypothetical protein